MDELTGVSSQSLKVGRVDQAAPVQKQGPLNRSMPQDAVSISNEALEKAKIDQFVEMLKQMPESPSAAPAIGQDPMQVVADKLVRELLF